MRLASILVVAVMLGATMELPPSEPPVDDQPVEEMPPGTVWYVHNLQGGVLTDMEGFDQQFLVESVPVALCESRMTETAVNRSSGATGLLQLMRRWHEEKAVRLGYVWGDMLKARANLHVAETIWARSGWGPWDCRP